MVVGDVRDEAASLRALQGVDKVVHLAAEVGVGQSMYAVDRYVSVNDYGTAVLFQQLIDKPVRRVVVASSMSIYGEGLYRDADGAPCEDAVRKPRAADDQPWDPLDAQGPAARCRCRRRSGSARPSPRSMRSTKYVQERLTLTLAPAYGMEGVALRLWNVYGPGQALSNPYTGVLAIFASRLPQRPARRWSSRMAGSAATSSMSRTSPALSCWRSSIRRRPARCYNIGSGEDRSVQRGRARCSRRRWTGRSSSRRSPARRASATSGTAFSDIAKVARRTRLRAPQGLLRGPRRTRRMGGAARRLTTGCSEARRELESAGPGGMSGTQALRPVRADARSWSPAARASSAPTSPTGSPREGHDVLVYDALARPGVERIWPGCRSGTRTGSPP